MPTITGQSTVVSWAESVFLLCAFKPPLVQMYHNIVCKALYPQGVLSFQN